MLSEYIHNKDLIEYVSVGHGAGTFNVALDFAKNSINNNH